MAERHRKAGLRAAELRAEMVDRLRYELEAHRPDLLPVLKKHKHRVRSSPRLSRYEWFVQWCDEQPDLVADCTQAVIDSDVAAMIAEYERSYHAA